MGIRVLSRRSISRSLSLFATVSALMSIASVISVRSRNKRIIGFTLERK
ncbi:hypothetical protein Hanom_Chr10g00900561 [Helianthus anomalus]